MINEENGVEGVVDVIVVVVVGGGGGGGEDCVGVEKE